MDGVEGDTIRNASGTIRSIVSLHEGTGVFKFTTFSSNRPITGGGSGTDGNFSLGFVIPVGPENSPRTLSIRVWRRIS